MKKIGLDIDEVLCDFLKGFYRWFNEPFVEKDEWNDPFVRNNFRQIINDKYFWLDLKPKIDPSVINFPIHCYITARPIPSYISFAWLTKNGFPPAPVFSTGKESQIHNSKVEVIDTVGVEIFVDDKPQHYTEINAHSNAKCFLMNHYTNQNVEAGEDRLFSLADLKDKL